MLCLPDQETNSGLATDEELLSKKGLEHGPSSFARGIIHQLERKLFKFQEARSIKAACLPAAVYLYHEFLKVGVKAEFKAGMVSVWIDSPDHPIVMPHAWVVVEGIVIEGSLEVRKHIRTAEGKVVYESVDEYMVTGSDTPDLPIFLKRIATFSLEVFTPRTWDQYTEEALALTAVAATMKGIPALPLPGVGGGAASAGGGR